MNVDNYTDEELYKELAENEKEWAYWETRDKRYNFVKRQILWAKCITLRDREELKRRGLPVE